MHVSRRRQTLETLRISRYSFVKYICEIYDKLNIYISTSGGITGSTRGLPVALSVFPPRPNLGRMLASSTTPSTQIGMASSSPSLGNERECGKSEGYPRIPTKGSEYLWGVERDEPRNLATTPSFWQGLRAREPKTGPRTLQQTFQCR